MGNSKFKHWVYAKRAQTGTDPRNTPFPATARAAANGYSRKLTAKSSPGRILVLLKGACLKEAEGMGNSKM